ncbi:MAG TPA: hypothetical protein VN256_11965 [Pyrinomonadaceae bacterium]|nr:hypothetical protein [Pyrinomonadaceae bacterium]
MALLFLVTLLAGAAAGPTTGQQQGAPSADPSLVAGSKKAILETGISEAYFDRHFRLARVVAAEGDRRVEWKFSVNGYEALLVDDIGYNTSEAGERVDVHSIKSELYSAHDITRTIPKRRARAALRTCIGEYADAMVVYRALKAPGKAGLYLTARAKIDFGDEGEEEEGEEEGEGGREVEGFSFNVGFIDLETGKCTVEKGQVTP